MGYRLIRWVGDPSPWDDPGLYRALIRQTISLPLLERFRRFQNHQRICAIPGKSVYSVGIADGFSRSYSWGPDQFLVWMDDADAEKLLANEWDRWQFLDVTDNPSQTERPPLSQGEWKQLLHSFEKLNAARKLKREYR